MTEPPVQSARRGARLSRGEWGLVALAAGLTVLTLGPGLIPALRFATLAPDIDLLINGIATVVASSAAWLAWLRYRHMADVSAVYQAAAFLLFAISAGVQTAANLGVGEQALGLDLANPRQAPVYAWTFLRLLAGALLLGSALLRLRPPASYRRPQMLVMLSVLVTLGVAGVLYAAEPYLPPLLSGEALERVGAPDVFTGPLAGITLLELSLQSVAVALLGAAAIAYAVGARRGRGPSSIYLAAGLVVAAFAQIHFALFPGIYSGLVTSSDLLRIAFYAFVVFGIQADAGATLRELRTANRQLHELRDAEVARASLAERARLAREVHDGLAQNLWLAKLATERLASAGRAEDVEAVRLELVGLLDAGIQETRETVVALREAAQPDAPLSEALTRHVRRFEAQTGLAARLSIRLEPDRPVPPTVAAELVRIAQEALNNVRKHADATVVSVEVEQRSDQVVLTVRDNGVGFDTSAETTGYGLEGMRERAEAVGGRLAIESGPSSGTTVVVEAPTA